MKVLFAVDEAYPLYKIGGLGDVGGSLPKAFATLGIDVRIALPRHPEISLDSTFKQIDQFHITYDKQKLPVTVLRGTLPETQIPVYLFEEKNYISQHTGASDNHADKFSVFSLAIAQWLALPQPTFKPHILHLHDWHTALIPLILKHKFTQHQFKTAINIHNLAYQGNTSTPIISKLGITAQPASTIALDQIDKNINILLQGILHSDIVVAVSPTYAKEILTTEYGEGIGEELNWVKDRIIGILNGLDLEVFDPQKDPHLFENFDSSTVKTGKNENKTKLQQQLQLKESSNLVIGFVGRVDPGQKGIQLIIEAIQSGDLPPDGTQFIFLGTGDPSLEKKLHKAASNQPNISITTRYDEALATRIYAASDLMLIPSKYEPCGLVQMIAMRYGALPVARKTGGLADTIIHNQDGFLFEKYTTEDMIKCLNQSLQTISDDETKQKMIQLAMSKDFSWTSSALKYQKIFRQLIFEETQTDKK